MYITKAQDIKRMAMIKELATPAITKNKVSRLTTKGKEVILLIT